ncbi:MAG TPA: MmgE/PrpD family protein [Cellulomonas sp.]
MTDTCTADIARHCAALSPRTIPAHVLQDARLLVVDTLGTLVGGWDSPPARIAQELASHETSTPGARVVGVDRPSSVEAAAFANTVAARYLDYNDTYQGIGTGHPSDMIPALLSVGEAYGRSGTDLLVAVVTAYEAFGAVAKTVPIRDKGFDQGVLIGLGTAAGAAKLMGLPEDQIREAVGLVVTMCVPLRSTRSGRLFMWKGAATAAATRLGVFAATLAAAGMTGPDQPIEGRHGLWEQVTGEFHVRPFGGDDAWMVSSTSIKFFAAESTSHGALQMVLQLRDQVPLSDIAHMRVGTFWNCYHEIASEPEKWTPETRETADHSLPFIMAACLVDGYISKNSFDAAHLADPRIRELMAKTTVEHEPAFTAMWPDGIKSSLDVTTVDGRALHFEVEHPIGHPKNRGTAADIEKKFLGNVTEAFGADRAAELVAALRDVDDLDAARLVDLFAHDAPVPAGR